MADFKVIDDLWICVDCAMMIANGETGDPETDPEAHADAIAANWPAPWQLVLNCSEDCDEPFSWHACDGCDSSLGGTRHRAVAMKPVETPA